MAPSRKTFVQQGDQVARTPPETPDKARQSRRRSASPPNQLTPARIRDEPPARSTRSWISAPPVSNITPTASQRIPVDCPIIDCRASTVHQHLPQLQYYLPRPGRTIHYRGYGNSRGDTSSRPSLVVSLQIARQAQSTTQPEPMVVDDEAPVQEENGEELSDVMSDVESAEDQAVSGEAVDVQNETTSDGPAVGPSLRAVGPSLQESQRTVQQEEGAVLQGDGPEFCPSADDLPISNPLSLASGLEIDRGVVQDVDGMQHLLPEQQRGLIQDEDISSLSQAPMTPPPSSPMAAEEGSSAQEMTGLPKQQEEQQSAASLARPMEFGDWLPGQRPEENVASPLTPLINRYDESIQPLIDPPIAPAQGMAEIAQKIQDLQGSTSPSYPGADEEDPNLPSLMLHSPVTEYMRQFQTEANDRDALADMLGLPNYATLSGISVDPTPWAHVLLSSNSGPVEPCKDEECPIEGEHSVGMYLHKGEMPHAFNADFGYSDPPPEVWYAWARIEELRAGEAEIAMVNGFAKCHWWNGK